MAITPTTPLDIVGSSETTDLETLINALRGNIIESIAESDGLTTYYLVNGTTITYQHAKQKAGILTGCEITRTSALNYDIDAGSYQAYGNVRTHAALVSLAVGSPHATLDRYDLIVGDDTGTLSVVAGTPSATPAYPSVAANETILHVIGVPALSSSLVDSAIVSQLVDTPTIPAVTVNTKGQVSIGGGAIKPMMATYTAAGNVDLTTTAHCVDTASLGSPFDLDLPDPTGNTEIEGITFNFFDIGGATANNWTLQYTIPPAAPTTLATATADNQIIRVTLIAGEYKVG